MSDLISKSELLKKFSVDSNGNKIPEYDVDNFPVTLTISEVKEIIRKAQTTSDKEIRDKAIEQLKNEICSHFADWQYSTDDKWVKDIIELASESVEEITEQMNKRQTQ